MPPIVEAALNLWPSAEPYWEGFVALDRGRTWAATFAGTVPQPLAYSEVARWGRDHGFEDDDLEEFVELIAQMDRTYLAAAAERLR